ncbi:MAG: hypothetical protein EON90_04280 [Brevundimonas sp.]|nr:MAG: hypothetical protein EON90_04280 [Brevundimonas sp.]
MAFIIGGLLVVVAIIAFVVWNNGGVSTPDPDETNVDVNIDLPQPKLPELPQPKLPDMPNVEPPTVPEPGPAPAQ